MGDGPADPELCVARASAQVRGRDRRGLRQGTPQGGVRALRHLTVVPQRPRPSLKWKDVREYEIRMHCVVQVYVQSNWNAKVNNSGLTCLIPTWGLVGTGLSALALRGRSSWVALRSDHVMVPGWLCRDCYRRWY